MCRDIVASLANGECQVDRGLQFGEGICLLFIDLRRQIFIKTIRAFQVHQYLQNVFEVTKKVK